MTRRAVNGIHLNVECLGQGPAIVLLHGFTGSNRNWRAILPAFTARYRVIAVEMPGHGLSDSPSNPDRYALPQLAQDLDSLLAELEISRAAVLGYSLGGRIALNFALTYPARLACLLLESASPGLPSPMERADRVQADCQLAEFIESHGLAAFVERWESIPLFESQSNLPETARLALRAQRLENNPRGLANSLRGAGTGSQASLWDELGRLKLPTLLLAGQLDTKFCQVAARMHELMPDSRLEIVAGAGHSVHLEKPDEFSRLALNFLENLQADKE